MTSGSSESEVQVSESEISQFDHTPYYCEENVYFLCKKLCESGVSDAKDTDLFVAFISNEKKQVPLWHQKASTRADGIILWDYHVICIQKTRGNGSQHMVWDLDSSLPFPSPLELYMSETIRPSFQLFADYQRFFRIVHAPIFLRYFASDRRHMKDSAGNWIAQPPAYEPIVAEDGIVHNLNEYMEISASDELTDDSDSVNLVFTQKTGVVISESQLEKFFSQICSSDV
ncbi:protein N-terminal glutamine amidohydrolase isoform X1 [Euphorbia lathyris]|uniref:protein N-terminal glutamine amidohydrolase isoform X1 n=1 Tax=Euphorbia lathyris TaxID=212925 RepID=UPI003313E62A